jgi:hypothetical protein
MLLTSIKRFFTGLMLLASTSAIAVPLIVDVTGITSNGELDSAGNVVMEYQVGANSTIDGISYSVNLTAFEPSWLSDIALLFSDSAGNGVIFRPAFEDDFPGTSDYAGSMDLTPLNLDFMVGADGILRLEFYEIFDDFPFSPDGIWNFGTITFNVNSQEIPAPAPEPATVLLLAGGLVIIGYGRRRSSKLIAG